MEYKLTVVTTTYNQEKYIEQCIKSILNQKTKFSFQLLVSDDGSTDKTKEILKEYESKYPDKLKVIYNSKNLGAMKNFVKTLNLANTEYVALCDGDDFWTDENKLQKQVDYLDKHPNYSICFHQTLIFFEDESRQSILHPINLAENLTLKDLIKENFIPANTVVYRWIYREKNSLKKDFPKKIVPGDYFLHFKHAKEGKIHYINEQMSSYRKQPSGMWYLLDQPDKQNEFYDIYGEKYLNFYKQVEKKMNLPKDTFNEQKNWIINRSLNAYINLRKGKKLKKLYKKNYKDHMNIFQEVLNTLDKKDRGYFYKHIGLINYLKKVKAVFIRTISSK